MSEETLAWWQDAAFRNQEALAEARAERDSLAVMCVEKDQALGKGIWELNHANSNPGTRSEVALILETSFALKHPAIERVKALLDVVEASKDHEHDTGGLDESLKGDPPYDWCAICMALARLAALSPKEALARKAGGQQ